jgi:toxin ParE1/3/4
MNCLKFHPGARRDENEAADWYAEHSLEAAIRLLELLDHSYTRIISNPGQFPLYLRGTRRLILQNFPYSIVFRELQSAVDIIAVAHAKRRPGYWKNRL